MRRWTRSSSPAVRCSAVQPKSVKHTVTDIPRRFPAIPWELMLLSMFVLQYKSCCQFQCACQRSKTSTQPDGDDRKRTDIAWVDGEGSSLERWLEKRVCVCLCIKQPVCMHSCGSNCVCLCISGAYTSQGLVSVCKYELSLINNFKRRSLKCYHINSPLSESNVPTPSLCSSLHALCAQTCLCEQACLFTGKAC